MKNVPNVECDRLSGKWQWECIFGRSDHGYEYLGIMHCNGVDFELHLVFGSGGLARAMYKWS